MAERRVAMPVLIVAGLVLAIAFLFTRISDTPSDEAFIELRVGENELRLDEGEHTLFWKTLAHPDEEAEFEDFEFDVEPAGAAAVVKPRFATGDPVGPDAAYVVLTIGVVQISASGDYRLRITVVGEVPPGQPLVER